MSRYRKDLGDFGEAAAAAYLKKKQYQILEKNYRTAGGELDLIARTKTHLIFVEVKTRSNLHYGRPIEAIDRKKMQHMRRAAAAYLSEHPTQLESQFDAVEVFAVESAGMMQLKEVVHTPNLVMEGA